MHEILNDSSELGDILPMPMPRPERQRYKSNVSHGIKGDRNQRNSPRIIAKPRESEMDKYMNVVDSISSKKDYIHQNLTSQKDRISYYKKENRSISVGRDGLAKYALKVKMAKAGIQNLDTLSLENLTGDVLTPKLPSLRSRFNQAVANSIDDHIPNLNTYTTDEDQDMTNEDYYQNQTLSTSSLKYQLDKPEILESQRHQASNLSPHLHKAIETFAEG